MKSYKNHGELLFPWKLFSAEYVDRPNRFLTRVRYQGRLVECHLPDPGRLRELLLPGVEVLIKPECGGHRKTQFSMQAVFCDRVLVSLNTWLPNRFVHQLLQYKVLSFWSDWNLVRSEYTLGRNRFDFLLERNSDELIIEVKSVTLVSEGLAQFPDAVTDRGARHLKHLGQLAAAGKKTAVLFVIQREDANRFAPHAERDPHFTKSLRDAIDQGVEIRIIKLRFTPEKATLLGSVPLEFTAIS